MIVETRKTAQGTEYWDNKEKRSLFVPAGKKPNFEVTKEYESMIGGVDLANGKDKTVINGKVVDEPDFEAMTVNTLRSYAAERNIEIPKEAKKKEDIINAIFDATADDE